MSSHIGDGEKKKKKEEKEEQNNKDQFKPDDMKSKIPNSPKDVEGLDYITE